MFLRGKIIFISVIIVGVFVAVFFARSFFVFSSNKVADSELIERMELCYEEVEKNGAVGFACYDKIFGEYLKEHEPRELLAEFSDAIEMSANVRRDCHQISHAIGHTTYSLLGDLMAVFQYDRDIDSCGGGFFHGAIEQMFRGGKVQASDEHLGLEEFEVRIPTICDQFDELGRRNECVHGVGHGAQFFLGTVNDALEACKLFSDKDRFSCDTGVFMEYIISGDSLAHNKEDPHFPCNKHEGKYREACYYEQSIRLVDMGFSGKELFAICNEVESAARYMCGYGYSIRYLAHEALATGVKKMAKFCESLNLEDTYTCVEGITSRLTIVDKGGEHSLQFCDALETEKFRIRCFSHFGTVVHQLVNNKFQDINTVSDCKQYVLPESIDECIALSG